MAQAPESAFAESIDVLLFDVDVWVADGAGDPVRGLDAADFEIVHDGEPVAISHFAEIRGGRVVAESGSRERAGAPSAEAGASGPRALPSHLIVYFDQARLHPSHAGQLARDLHELVTSGAVDPARVLVLRHDRSLTVEAPFGSSADELARAFERLRGGSAAGMDQETEFQMAMDAIREAWEQSEDALGAGLGGVAQIPSAANPTGEPPGSSGAAPSSGFGSSGGGGGDSCGMFVNQVQPTLRSFTRSRAQRLSATLSGLFDSTSFLSGLAGVKTLLYLSDGLDTEPGAALAAYATGLCPGAGRELLHDAQSEEMTDRLLELTRHANTNQVSIHTLQATGLSSPGAASAARGSGVRGGGSLRSGGAFEARKRGSEREGLVRLARETGGRAIFDLNDFGPELARLGAELDSYYSLAYAPPSAAGGGDARRGHAVEVRLSDPSLTTRYRRGFLPKDPEQALRERVAGALNLGITSNTHDLRLAAGAAQPGSGGARSMPLFIRVPVEQLTFAPHDGQLAAVLAVRVLVRNLASGAVALRDQEFRIKGTPGATGRADLPLRIDLEPGLSLAAVGLLDRASGRVSFVATELDAGG